MRRGTAVASCMARMRCLAIFAVAVLTLVPGGSARGQVMLTLAGGPNLATLAHSGRPGTLKPWSRHGVALGLAAGFPVSDGWGIQLGAGISSKGVSWTGDCGPRSGMPGTCSHWIDYLESTVLVDRRVELGNPVLHLLAGPFVGYQVFPGGCSASFDLGVALGVQLDAALFGKLRFALGPMYAHGLKDVMHGIHTARSAPDIVRTRTLTLRTGLSYSIG